MIARYTSAIVTGSATTFCLFFLMQALIALQPGAASEPRQRWALEFVRVKPPEEIRTNEFDPIDDSIKNPPPTPPRTPADPGDEVVVGIETPSPPVPVGETGGNFFRIDDGPLVAIVRVQPVYPAVAEARGLEGWVLVQFDVRPDGGVANAFIVDSSSRLFEKAALNAAYKFRFKPRVVDGIPQLTTGLQNLFRFEFEDR